MKDDIYTISRLCEELNQPRQKIRRRINKLGVKAINENTRTYKNEPLEYSEEAYLELLNEFNNKNSVQQRNTDSTSDRNTKKSEKITKEDDKDNLISVLKSQLEETNKSRANLEKLLDQQQKLTLMANNEIETLKLEMKEEEKETTNNKWFGIFKKNK